MKKIYVNKKKLLLVSCITVFVATLAVFGTRIIRARQRNNYNCV